MWVDRIALTFTSPDDQTTCGSFFGSKVMTLINSAGPPAVRRSLSSEWRWAISPDWMNASPICSDELPAAHGEPQRRYDIGTADHVDLWPRRVEVPTQLNDVGKALGVIRMHMREEDRIELHRATRRPAIAACWSRVRRRTASSRHRSYWRRRRSAPAFRRRRAH